MNPALEIQHAAIGLRVGENISINCPFCGGGTNRDRRTCSIGRMVSGSLVYLCRRAKCGKTGRIDGLSGGDYSHRTRPVEFIPRVYSGVIEELPDEICTYLGDKYGLSAQSCRDHVGWDSDSKRTVWKIVGPHGAIRGYELRDHWASQRESWKKSIHYRHSPSPWLGYYPHYTWCWQGGESEGETNSNTDNVLMIVVEDVISALKISQYTNAVSLMGTSLTLEKVSELRRRTETIILALDRDATEKARMFISRFALVMPGVKLLPLRKDMKYWSGPEIEELTTVRL